MLNGRRISAIVQILGKEAVCSGEKEVLYSSKQKLSVVTLENLFEKINECHTAIEHLGCDKTWHKVRHDGRTDFLIYFFVVYLKLPVSILWYHCKWLKFSSNYVTNVSIESCFQSRLSENQ